MVKEFPNSEPSKALGFFIQESQDSNQAKNYVFNN